MGGVAPQFGQTLRRQRSARRCQSEDLNVRWLRKSWPTHSRRADPLSTSFRSGITIPANRVNRTRASSEVSVRADQPHLRFRSTHRLADRVRSSNHAYESSRCTHRMLDIRRELLVFGDRSTQWLSRWRVEHVVRFNDRAIDFAAVDIHDRTLHHCADHASRSAAAGVQRSR